MAEDGNAAAIRRSLDIYYRDAARTARMDRLNARFVQAGDLAFDIGAHVGDRTGSFLRLGARVVTVEPQPVAFRALRLIYGRAPRVALIASALGATQGEIVLHLNAHNPTVSTVSEAMIAAAPGDPRWRGQVWDRTLRVPLTTLDQLIAAHGMPAFVKIDVEGHEADVLAGLTTALPALSFEITTLQREVGIACLERLATLGQYRFNLSLGERHEMQFDNALSADDMREVLAALPQDANSGDIYACRE